MPTKKEVPIHGGYKIKLSYQSVQNGTESVPLP